MKQTAVEWLVNEMPVIDWQDPYWKIKLEKAKAMEKEQKLNTDTVTRFEVIDHTKEMLGRAFVKYGVNVELSFQDDNKTLKVFLTDK
jgi:hypothetical protein